MDRPGIRKAVGVVCLFIGAIMLVLFFTIQEDTSLELVSVPRLSDNMHTLEIGEHAVITPSAMHAVQTHSSLPEGLSINTETGVISGTPTRLMGPVPVKVDNRVMKISVVRSAPNWPSDMDVYAGKTVRIMAGTHKAVEIRAENPSPEWSVRPDGNLVGAFASDTVLRLAYKLSGQTRTHEIRVHVQEFVSKLAGRVANAAPTVTYSIPTTLSETTLLNLEATGTADRFEVSPALPDKLTLNRETGAITGYLPAGLPSDHSIMAYDANGEMTTIPIRLYSEGALVYGALTTVVKSSNVAIEHKKDARFNQYEAHPFLPSGLTINQDTGDVTGTPKMSSGATPYEVTAWNSSSGATAKGTLNLEVVDGDASDMKVIFGLGCTFAAAGVLLIGTAYIPNEFWTFRWDTKS